MYRYKIHIEYNGSNYAGWQKQANLITIQATIEQAIEKMTSLKVTLYCAGRTDAGVHAIEQVAHFDMEKYFSAYTLQSALNHFLKNQQIAIFKVIIFTDNNLFHARFSAIAREYNYKIINRSYPLTYQQHLYWWIPQILKVETMAQAAQLLIGTHDFSSFRASGCQASSAIRTLDYIDITKEDDIILMTIKAKSFLYHQVRNIIGSLYLVGLGKWSIADFQQAFKLADRTVAGITAPAHGLYLKKIYY